MTDGPLSLPARLCLLAWDTAPPAAPAGARPAHLVRAGALLDLARRDLLHDDDGTVTPADLDSRTGDAALDGLLDLVRESLPHSWRTWVTLRARITFDAVREQLVSQGWVRAERRRVLGVFPSVEYTLARAAAVHALREEARRTLYGPVPAAQVPARDAAVVALAAAARLRALGTARDRAAHTERLGELTARAAEGAGPRAVARELCAALDPAGAGAVAPTAR